MTGYIRIESHGGRECLPRMTSIQNALRVRRIWLAFRRQLHQRQMPGLYLEITVPPVHVHAIDPDDGLEVNPMV